MLDIYHMKQIYRLNQFLALNTTVDEYPLSIQSKNNPLLYDEKKTYIFSLRLSTNRSQTLKTIVLSIYNIGFPHKVLLFQVQHCLFLEEVSFSLVYLHRIFSLSATGGLVRFMQGLDTGWCRTKLVSHLNLGIYSCVWYSTLRDSGSNDLSSSLKIICCEIKTLPLSSH